jgi:glycosyltransferase involved in cell wall biosynthesis
VNPRSTAPEAVRRAHPTRLLYLVPVLETGGTERLVSDLALGLTGPGYRVSVAAFRGGEFAKEIGRNGVTPTILGDGVTARTRLGRLAQLRRRLRRLLGSGFDIVHTHHLGMLGHVLAACPGKRPWKWVHTEHVPIDGDPTCARVLARLAPFLLRWPDALTGVCDAVCDYYVKRASIPAAQVHTIYNGVDVDQFAKPRDGSVKRREQGIPDDAWVVGIVANLRAQKNHALALRAFARVRAEAPAARLVLVGGGPLMGALREQAQGLGIADSVSFLGPRTDVPELFATFDAYCLPSHYEGMPLSLFEAMAARCPIVATRVPGIREVVVDGETALLVPPDDAASLADALLRLRADRDLAAALARAAWRYVDEHGRGVAMRQRYNALYEALLT